MRHFSKSENISLLILFVVVFAAVFGSRSLRLYQAGVIVSDEPAELLLYEQVGLSELADELEYIGIEINRDELFWAGNTLRYRFFRPGRYVLDRAYSYSELLPNLARGIQDPARVTIFPGTDVGRLSRSLSRQLRPDSTAFSEVFQDSSEIALEYGLTGEKLFSRMLPNSYDMYWTSTPGHIVRRLMREFERSVVDRYSDQIEEHFLDLEEIIILASIVEMEARHNDEKSRISGLYINRLNSNMRLQADPTVIYALGERRRLLFEDYQIDHPYNTYQFTGLPPGPITNPSLSTILSVLNPEEHDYLFMVATPEGNHRFSRTFDEHRAASEEWRRWIREQYRLRDLREQEEQNQQ